MFTGFYDASGSEDQSVLAVAGFVATAEEWIDWETTWLKRLAEDGLKRFHNKELNDWEASRKSVLIADLCAIIKDHVSRKVGVVVVTQDLDIFSTAEREKWGINPYTLACWIVAGEMSKWARSWSGPYPEPFFEKGDAGQKWLDRFFECVGYPRPNIKRKKDYVNPKTGIMETGLVPFDAADLFAYELFSRVRLFVRDGHISDGFKRINSALDNIPGAYGTVERERVALLKQALEQEEADSPILVPTVKIKTS
jgi:hypothetical protein